MCSVIDGKSSLFLLSANQAYYWSGLMFAIALQSKVIRNTNLTEILSDHNCLSHLSNYFDYFAMFLMSTYLATKAMIIVLPLLPQMQLATNWR